MRIRVAIAIIAAALTAGGCALVPLLDLAAVIEPGPAVVVAPGLTPRMTPDQVSDRVLGLIDMNEEIAGQVAMPPKILRLTATTGARIAEVEPSAGQQWPAEPGIVWVVRAEGTFTTNRYPPGAKPAVATSGFYVISDSDGGVLGFGFP